MTCPDSTRPTYTEADVMRLVMEVTHMLRNSPRAVFNQDGIEAALRPFAAYIVTTNGVHK